MSLTDEGYTAPRAADLLDEIRADFEEESELKPVWSRDTVLGPLTVVMASKLGDLYELTQAIYDSRDPNNAAGVQLSSLGVATGVERDEASYSQATVTFTGDSGTDIPEGTLVSDGEARWQTTEDVTIGEGGTVDVVVRCTEPGAVTAGAGEIDELISAVFGVDSVTNASAATPGEDREDDGTFRLRWKQSLQRGASSSTAAIRASVLDVEGVSAAVVLKNDDATSTTIEGISMDPCSVAVIVYPDTLTDDQEEALVRAIFAKVAAGTKLMGSQTREVATEVGTVEEVAWDWATELTVTVAIEIEMQESGPGLPEPPDFADVEDAIVEAIEEYGAGLALGEDVRQLPIQAAVDEIEGVRAITSLTLALDPADPSRVDAAGNLEVLATEIATIDPSDIAVTEA